MKKHNITYVLFVKNEEKRIEYALRPLKDLGDVMVIDDESSDRTKEIAKKYTDKVFIRKRKAGWVEDEETVNYVTERASTDWLFWLFADEILAPSLVKRLADLSLQDQHKVIWTFRRNYNYGGVNLNNDYSLRCFKVGAIDFRGNTIGQFGKVIVSKEEQLYLPKKNHFAIHHFSAYNLEKFELAHSKYSSIEARDNVNRGKKFSGSRLILRPLYYFLRDIVKGGAWRWGWRGVIIAAQYAFFYFNTYAKMWEIENNVTLESIERKYSEMKKKLLETKEEIKS